MDRVHQQKLQKIVDDINALLENDVKIMDWLNNMISAEIRDTDLHILECRSKGESRHRAIKTLTKELQDYIQLTKFLKEPNEKVLEAIYGESEAGMDNSRSRADDDVLCSGVEPKEPGI